MNALPPMDDYTVETLALIDNMRAGRCACGYDPSSASRRVPDRDYLTLDQYAALLESRELTAGGEFRCAAWAPSQNRRCAQHGHDGHSTVWARFSECCAHPGVWLNLSGLGEWLCERHR